VPPAPLPPTALHASVRKTRLAAKPCPQTSHYFSFDRPPFAALLSLRSSPALSQPVSPHVFLLMWLDDSWPTLTLLPFNPRGDRRPAPNNFFLFSWQSFTRDFPSRVGDLCLARPSPKPLVLTPPKHNFLPKVSSPSDALLRSAPLLFLLYNFRLYFPFPYPTRESPGLSGVSSFFPFSRLQVP